MGVRDLLRGALDVIGSLRGYEPVEVYCQNPEC